jgi:hypothetical protein
MRIAAMSRLDGKMMPLRTDRSSSRPDGAAPQAELPKEED